MGVSVRKENLEPLVRAAWESAPVGESVVQQRRVVKHKSILVVSPSEKTLSTASVHFVYAFPRLEHFDAFVKAKDGLQAGGPAENAPGSIGSARLRKDPVQRAFSLVFVQAHYKTGARRKSNPYLSRSLATKYGGWRVRVLEEAIRVAHSQGYGFQVKTDAPNMRRLLQPQKEGDSAFMKDLKKACDNLGVKLTGGIHLTVQPPTRRL